MLYRTARRVIPTSCVELAMGSEYTFSVLRSLWGFGKAQQKIQCVICGSTARFKAYGHPPRYQAKCPRCFSLERHRLLMLVAEREQLFSGKSVLHFAPEKIVQKLVKPKTTRYLSGDIRPDHGDVELNIEAINQPDESWDVVIASHVLEHVNDKAALSEIYRVMKRRGKFIAMTPIIEGWNETYENRSITQPADRLLHFGQADHVRYYGRDFRERLEAAGFQVNEFSATGEECVKFGLLRGEKIFVSTK
jgi:SAM-dependent methyltransferase